MIFSKKFQTLRNHWLQKRCCNKHSISISTVTVLLVLALNTAWEVSQHLLSQCDFYGKIVKFVKTIFPETRTFCVVLFFKLSCDKTTEFGKSNLYIRVRMFEERMLSYSRQFSLSRYFLCYFFVCKIFVYSKIKNRMQNFAYCIWTPLVSCMDLKRCIIFNLNCFGRSLNIFICW